MKFRCDRDVLAEALGTAGRAVANRGGALPVLSGVRLQLTGGDLQVTGSDLDLTISVTVGVNGEEDGVVVLPRAWPPMWSARSRTAWSASRPTRSRPG